MKMKIIARLLVVFVVMGHVCANAAPDDSSYLPSRNDEQVLEPESGNRIQVVFYRIGGSNDLVPTVKINDSVVGALLPDNYAKTFACGERFEAGVATRGEKRKITEKIVTSETGGKVVFVKVMQREDGSFFLGQVDARTAREEIRNFRLKSHIINRYQPECGGNVRES